MDDYDSPWKTAITECFGDFLSFFFPAAHAAIDWRSTPVFLDQELAQLSRAARVGRRRLDRLVRVAALDHSPQLVYIHVEVQGQRERDFAERLFTYHYRLYDRYRCPISSLVVLADAAAGWRPNEFRYELFDCRLCLSFPVVKLLDYQGRMTELLRSENVFALVTAAHLMTRATSHQLIQRADVKLVLASLLYEKGWSARRVVTTMHVLDWMMALPEELQRSFEEQVLFLEGVKKVPYMDSWQRHGWERGHAEGREAGRDAGHKAGFAQGLQEGLVGGRQEGLEEGLMAARREILEALLYARFGPLPAETRERIACAASDELLVWNLRTLDADTLDDIFDY